MREGGMNSFVDILSRFSWREKKGEGEGEGEVD